MGKETCVVTFAQKALQKLWDRHLFKKNHRTTYARHLELCKNQTPRLLHYIANSLSSTFASVVTFYTTAHFRIGGGAAAV